MARPVVVVAAAGVGSSDGSDERSGGRVVVGTATGLRVASDPTERRGIISVTPEARWAAVQGGTSSASSRASAMADGGARSKGATARG